MSSYVPISSQTLGSAASSVTFSSIPTTLNGKTLRDLVLVFRPQLTSAANVEILFNSSTSGYSFCMGMGLGGGSTSSDAFGGRNALELYNAAPDTSSIVRLEVFDFAQTNRHKTSLLRNDRPTSFTQMLASRWANTSAISSITINAISASFQANSTFTLWGIEA